jgi:hypothetical protein
MTALRNACSATDTVLDIDTPLNIADFPKPYTIGSEVINVVGGGYATSITVQRGVLGSTRAAHVNGSTLTAANAFSGGGGGGDVPDPTGAPDGQVPTTSGGVYALGGVLSVIGPFTVAWDTPGIHGEQVLPFLTLAELGAGTFVLSAFGYATADWDIATALHVDVANLIGDSSATVAEIGVGGAVLTTFVDMGAPSEHSQFFVSDGLLAVWATPLPPGAATTGSADIYALIWSPA